MSPRSMHHFHCKDPDEFREKLSGVSCDMWITGVQQRRWMYQSLQLGSLLIQQGEMGSGNLLNAQTLPHQRMIYVLEESCGTSLLNGSKLSNRDYAFLSPNMGFTLSHSRPHRWMALSLPWSYGGLESSTVLQPGIIHPITSRLTEHSQIVGRILDSSKAILAAASRAVYFECTPASEAAHAHLLELIQRLWRSASPAEEPIAKLGRPPIPRSSILAACHHYLLAAPLGGVSLQGMAEHCGISPRTLRSVFQEQFGFGPSRFLQLRQLHCVYRDLKEANPSTNRVTDILLKDGVWNFNHFGRRYKQLFGESPSATLRSA